MTFDDSGALSTGQRLTRIENRLDTLITGMERLAEEADLRALTSRVELLERDGSSHARRAEVGLTAAISRITTLETEERVARALESNQRSNRKTILAVILGMAGWASVVVAVVTLWHHP